MRHVQVPFFSAISHIVAATTSKGMRQLATQVIWIHTDNFYSVCITPLIKTLIQSDN